MVPTSEKILLVWFPGTWECDMYIRENPSATNFVGLGLWLVDARFPDRLPLNIFQPFMMCPPDYTASFGPIPAAGSSPFKSLGALSYEESVRNAVDNAVEQMQKLPRNQNIIVAGYSQGAEAAERVKAEFASGGRLFGWKLLACYTFGNPARPTGVTFPNGNVLPWGGIAKMNLPTPQGCLYRSYGFYDDMYTNANPDSYLFDFYNTLTDIQFHDPFKAVTDGLLNLSKTDLMILMGAKPTDPLWVITHIPTFIAVGRKATNTIGAAVRFIGGAHGHYHDWEIIPGFSPIFHAIRSMKYLAKGIGYVVPGL